MVPEDDVAPRPFWKGYLKLSLVTCPVAMTPGTSEGDRVRFHTLNRATGNRVRSRYVDAVTGATVDEDDEVKGYQRGEDDFVMLEDGDLDAVALASTRTIDIETFVPKDSIEWIWYDKPHYLAPDDPVGEQAFCVIRKAMEKTGTVAISRLVLYRRERAVMLEPRDRGIVLWTLRYGDEVRDEADTPGRPGREDIDPDVMALVTTLIGQRTRPWSPAMVSDPVQERLLGLIASRRSKKAKAVPVARPKQEPPGNVVSIMDALRRSLASEPKSAAGKGKPARRR